MWRSHGLFLHYKDLVSLPFIPTDDRFSRAVLEKTVLII